MLLLLRASTPGSFLGSLRRKKRPDFDAFGPFLCEGASGIGEGRSAEEPPGRGRDATPLGPSPRLTSHISSCFPAPLLRIHPSLSKSALLSQPARNSTRLRFIPVASVSLHHDIISLPSFFLPLTFPCDVSLQRAQPPPAVFDSLLRIRGIKVSNSRDVPQYGRTAASGCRSGIRSPNLQDPPDPQNCIFSSPTERLHLRGDPRGAFDPEYTCFHPGQKSATCVVVREGCTLVW